jgi:anti-sigma-K factor RskA
MTTPAADRETLAAEYVLGLLDPAVEAEAERLLIADAAFAREVEAWRMRMSDFDRSVESAHPTEALWADIDRDVARPAAAEAGASGWTARLWNSLPAWRAMALAASAAGLVLAVGLGFALREARRTPALIAVLVDGDRAGAVVHVFHDGRAVLLPLTSMAVPSDRALQVWTLPSRERGPVSVGLMQQAQTLPLVLDNLPATRAQQLFEITLEPKAGSPTGRPTGPILFKGLASPTL